MSTNNTMGRLQKDMMNRITMTFSRNIMGKVHTFHGMKDIMMNEQTSPGTEEVNAHISKLQEGRRIPEFISSFILSLKWATHIHES